jgi:hypothetical protein
VSLSILCTNPDVRCCSLANYQNDRPMHVPRFQYNSRDQDEPPFLAIC